MKKNKKLFAILTLVAFMMSLVPTLAFAAGEGLSVEKTGDTLTFTITGFTADTLYKIKTEGDVDVANAKSPASSTSVFNIADVKIPSTTTTYKLVDENGDIDGATAVYRVGNAIENATAKLTKLNSASTEATVTVEGLEANADYNTDKGTFDKDAGTVKFTNLTAGDDIVFTLTDKTEANNTKTFTVKSYKAATDVANALSTLTVKKDATTLIADKVAGFTYSVVEVSDALKNVVKTDGTVVPPSSEKEGTVVIKVVRDFDKESEYVTSAVTVEAATAAPSGDGRIDFTVSVFGAKYANGGNPSVGSKVQTNVLFMDKDGKDVDNVAESIIIWAEDVTNTGVPTTALTVENAQAGEGKADVLDDNKNVYTITAKNDQNINLIFSRAGEYNIYAAEAGQTAEGKTVAEQIKNTTKMKLGNSKVVVNDLATDPRQTYTATINGSFWSDGQTLKDGESSKVISVKANNVATTNVTVTMKNEGNRLVGKTVNIESNSANLTPSKKSAVTNSMGQIDFDLSGSREGTYYVFLSCDGFEVKLQVTVGNTAAAYIAVDSQPDAPIALFGNSDDLDIKVNLTDINGNVVTGVSPEGAKNAFDNTTKYVSFTEKPAGTNLKDKDLSLAYNSDDEYYVKVAQTFDKEGTYEIKVVLDNGNYVVVPFEVKRFETPVQILLDYNQSSIELNGTSNVPSVKYVDANGVKQNARNKVTIAATGYAIAKFDTSNGRITVKNDEKYIGQTITVTAVDSRYNLTATQTLTVADEAQGIKFDTTKAQVNVNNKIDFHVTDANGNTVALGNNADVKEVNFIITSKPEGAKVSAVTSGNYKKDLQSEGKATMALTSDKEGEVTVQVLVSVEAVSENSTTGLVNKYYTGTETFKVTKEIGKGSAVVMTIGSATMVVNDTTVAIDSPAMIKDNRTFVPVRALMEAFGATVDFDEATNKVTIKADGKTIELTLGSTVMTVGDKAVTMDVAAFATNEGRTMVPVRAIAEAAGYTVEATYNADGTTASVVFTK